MPSIIIRPEASVRDEEKQFKIPYQSNWCEYDTGICSETGGPLVKFLSAPHVEDVQRLDYYRIVEEKHPSSPRPLHSEFSGFDTIGTALTSSDLLGRSEESYAQQRQTVPKRRAQPQIVSVEFEMNPIVNIVPPVVRRRPARLIDTRRAKFSTTSRIRIEGIES